MDDNESWDQSQKYEDYWDDWNEGRMAQICIAYLSDQVDWMASWYSVKELAETGMVMEIVTLQVECSSIKIPHGSFFDRRDKQGKIEPCAHNN